MADTISATHRFLIEIAEELSARDLSFPTFLDATLKIRMALNKADITAEELAKVVATEPLLSAKLVRLANSVAMNPSGQQVVDVRTAVIRVGFSSVRTLAIALAMEQLMQTKEMGDYVRYARPLWEHSVDVAAQAFVLARRLTRINPHEALFAGIVHNIGAFYLLARIASRPDVAPDGEELTRLIDEWQSSIGHAVLSALEIPDEILAAIADQETPFTGEIPATLAQILYAANRLSERSGHLHSVAPDQHPPALQRAAEIIAGSQEERTSLIAALGR